MKWSTKVPVADGEVAVWVMLRLRRHCSPSYEFTQLIHLHGIGLVGRNVGDNRRTLNSKAFHSLRAIVSTMLQTTSVLHGLAMELVVHKSAEVHAVYIRPTAEHLREAAGKMKGL